MTVMTIYQNGNIRKFPLAVEELALALGLINRPDLGQNILAAAYEKLTKDQASERLTTASHTLLARDLCSFSKEGLPILDRGFEEALFPLARFDFLIQVGTIQGGIQRSMVIHVIKNRFFTSHFVQNGIIHTLEYGKFEQMMDYLLHNLGDIKTNELKNSTMQLKIKMEALGQATKMKQDQTQAESMLLAANWPETQAKMLAEDMSHQLCRSTIVRINVASDTKPENIKESSKPTLLLLQGTSRSWLFEFSSPDDQAVGTAQIGDKKKVGEVLYSFIT